jgi:hypothetical protein
MKIPKSDKDGFQRFYNKYETEFFPLHFTLYWKGTRDEGGHTHCLTCDKTIEIGDMCFVKYLERVSVTLCNDCVNDNFNFLSSWIDWEHQE